MGIYVSQARAVSEEAECGSLVSPACLPCRRHLKTPDLYPLWPSPGPVPRHGQAMSRVARSHPCTRPGCFVRLMSQHVYSPCSFLVFSSFLALCTEPLGAHEACPIGEGPQNAPHELGRAPRRARELRHKEVHRRAITK